MKAFVRKAVLFLSVAAVLGTCLWGGWRAGLFNVQKIEVLPKDVKADSASFLLLKNRVESTLSSLVAQPLWSIDIAEVTDRVKAEKWIRDVYVNRSIMGELKVWIRPREVAAVMIDKEGGVSPVALDGSLLPPVEGQEIPDAPFLTGKPLLENLNLRRRAVEVLEGLPMDGELTRDSVSEVFYTADEGFVLVLTEGGVKVYLGQKSSVGRVARVSQVLSYLRMHGKSAESIDSRFNQKVLVREKHN